ncbi:hypothetical protein KXD40_005944 [Peronospora effusa]|nr:hypothetical protein KXD40_005941 [Peronospora effusa]UIZ25486.1 hypothetical protein KXD40_005940 [Peronospora effusa]UIZ25490.1 hypothetical protein KXD40_005944 [Peronospora effusa]
MPWIWVRVLGSQLSSQIITCETTRVEAVSTELQHIMVLDCDPQESDFPLLLYSNRRGLAVSSIQQGRKLSLDFKIEMQSNAWLLRRSPTDILFVNMFPYLLRKSHRMAADTKYLYVHILCCVCASVLTLAYEGRGVDEGIQRALH